ncbi:MarR family transcriptional regulator [Pseudoalteromonas sp. S16_S37]|uniref:MarR family transcriptional regulator n=1 Tax=Pseudoalteromonas sp. S16_S37 TaxID=2720228 RepID=UPI0016804756|nr:MarR family transcriptional regulator [Pseudoalteromonas sp. S16_S37]MBD1584636.1 MarR family transcriptional regulator [Pseudoalteromonas sp. S16_S37]
MVDSQALQLVSKAAKVHNSISKYLSGYLQNKGFIGATPSALNFLSALECGENYGSQIARSLDVSRQMVAKSVKEMCSLGYLEQKTGHGKQKVIVFTELGEQLMAEARLCLSGLDKLFCEQMEQHAVDSTIANLEQLQLSIELLAGSKH